MPKEQLVKTPEGEWILLSEYLRGGDVYQMLPFPDYDICVRLFGNTPGKNHLILKNKCQTKEEGQTILDEWIEKVKVLREQDQVEQPVETPDGKWVLLSSYGEVVAFNTSVYLRRLSVQDSTLIAEAKHIEEANALVKQWSQKLIEARQKWR